MGGESRIVGTDIESDIEKLKVYRMVNILLGLKCNEKSLFFPQTPFKTHYYLSDFLISQQDSMLFFFY